MSVPEKKQLVNKAASSLLKSFNQKGSSTGCPLAMDILTMLGEEKKYNQVVSQWNADNNSVSKIAVFKQIYRAHGRHYQQIRVIDPFLTRMGISSKNNDKEIKENTNTKSGTLLEEIFSKLSTLARPPNPKSIHMEIKEPGQEIKKSKVSKKKIDWSRIVF